MPTLAVVAVIGGWLARAAAQDSSPAAGDLTSSPAGILPGSPLAQVVKLAKAGVDEGLILAYVTNSTSTFNLDPDKIIYLKDAGVPNDLVTDMMQRDTTLQGQMTTASVPPTPALPQPDATAPDVTPPTPTPPPIDPNAPTDGGTPPPPPAMVADGSQPVDDSAPPDEPVTLNNFYDTLSPYGNWVQIDGYGRCWQPGVGIYDTEWQPYGDHGHWVYTDYGWYWMSDYAWGWAPFHYGRWLHNDGLGWVWSPDTVWGPSWVTWRYSDNYCGWAPLPPGAYYQNGVGYMYRGRGVGVDFNFGLRPNEYVFVGTHDFTDPHPFRHRLGAGSNGQAYEQTTVANGIGHTGQGFVNYGINPTRIAQINHTTIPAVPLQVTAGGTGRGLPSEPIYRAGGVAYTGHPQSGYLRTANGDGTHTVSQTGARSYYTTPATRSFYTAPATRSYYTPPVAAPAAVPATEYPPREEPPRQAAPEQNYRPAPSVPARTYTVPAAHPTSSSQQSSQQKTGPR